MAEEILNVLMDGSGALHAALSSPAAAAMLPLLLPKCGNSVDILDEEGRTALSRWVLGPACMPGVTRCHVYMQLAADAVTPAGCLACLQPPHVAA